MATEIKRFIPNRSALCTGSERTSTRFANVEIHLIPSPKSRGVRIVDDEIAFVDQAGNPYMDELCKWFVRGVHKGIEDVVDHYRGFGVEISGCSVVIQKLVVHQVDSTEGTFRIAARNAMASCLVNAT